MKLQLFVRGVWTGKLGLTVKTGFYVISDFDLRVKTGFMFSQVSLCRILPGFMFYRVSDATLNLGF